MVIRKRYSAGVETVGVYDTIVWDYRESTRQEIGKGIDMRSQGSSCSMTENRRREEETHLALVNT